jgi:hypothetical protein
MSICIAKVYCAEGHGSLMIRALAAYSPDAPGTMQPYTFQATDAIASMENQDNNIDETSE